MRIKALGISFLVLIGLTACFALQSFNVALADTTGGLTISGGQQGTDYTYEDGVLRIIAPGTYSLGMADGVSSTSDRIVIEPPDGASGQTFNLTFDNLNLTNETENCFYIENREHQRDKINITLKGENSFSTEQSAMQQLPPFHSHYMIADMTISGTGTLVLTSAPPTYREFSKGAFNTGSLTLNSGTIICNYDHITSNSFVVNDGTVNISKDYRGIYCTEQFAMYGGQVTLNTINYGIQVTGDGDAHRLPADGVVIVDGTLEITASGDGNLSYGILLGSQNDASIVKNIRIASSGVVTINCPRRGFGIGATNNATRQNLYMGGKELEITVESFALTRMKMQYAPAYVHKNYAGDSAADRKVKVDSGRGTAGMINQDTGYANASFKYVLITPAYPISYELNGGSLAEGETNPETYSRVDSFTLYNPSREGDVFEGWTGTDLSSATETVTIEEGSTGARSYTATYRGNLTPIDEVIVKNPTYNGTEQAGVPESEGYSVENGANTNAGTYTAIVTPKDGYCWEDGSTGPREVKYTIAKAKLTASYPGETIEWYEKPKLEVQVSGFVGSDNASNAKGYKTPVIQGPNTAPHQSYTLAPSGGEADNYTFIYKEGTLTVKCNDILLVEAKAKGKSVKLSWNKVSGATSFEIYSGLCGRDLKYMKTINSGNTLKYTVKGLKNKTYKFYVVAYREVNGEKIKLATSECAHTIVNKSDKKRANASKIKLNKKTLTIKTGKSSKVKATVTCAKGKQLLWKTHCDKIRYYSSDVHIAKVSKKGKITGVMKGKCKVYAVAPNGIKTFVTVTIK